MHGNHTPTPWVLMGESENDNGEVTAIDPVGIDGRESGGWPYVIVRPAQEVGRSDQWIAHGIQDLDDARLLLAAPAMLEALDEALQYLANSDQPGSWGLAKRIGAILREVRGNPPAGE